MKKTITTTIILAIISGCSSTTPEIYTPSSISTKNYQVPISPQVTVKQESPFDRAKKSCVAKNSQGCIDLANILIEQKDYEMAKTVFHMAFAYGDKDGGMRGIYMAKCFEKDAESCDLLGYRAEEGKGGIQDYKLARVSYQKAIDLGSTDALSSLARLYGEGLGGAKSYVKARKLYEASCNACTTRVKYESCHNAGIMYDKGQGVRQNKFKAVKLYRKACNGGYPSACNNLGVMYKYGEGVRQDKATAQMYYGKACDMGSDLGCSNYAKNNR